MAKYKLKALNVLIGGRLFKKEEGTVFDDTTMPKSEIEAAFKAGFLVKVEVEKPKTEKKVEVEKPKTEK